MTIEGENSWRFHLNALGLRLGPVGPVLLWLVTLLILLSAFRLLHSVLYAHRVVQVDGWGWMPLIGLRLDLVLGIYLSALPLLALVVFPMTWWRRHPKILATYAAVILGVLIYLELATIPFMAEFDSRPNRIFVEYLAYPREVLATVIKTAPAMAVVALLLAAGGGWLGWRGAHWCLRRSGEWRWWVRVALFIALIIPGLIGVRGLGHRPLNPSTAAVTGDNLVNQLGLNSIYSLCYAIYQMRHEGDPRKYYGRDMSETEQLARVAAVSKHPEWNLNNPVPTRSRIVPRASTSRPRNLVIILEESLGAEFVGCLGGLPLTPEFDRLASEGLLLTDLYSTGTRTVRGIEAVWSGFLPTPGRSVVKLGGSQNGFFMVAKLLAEHGYDTRFIYGGERHFDNMAGWMTGNGVQSIHDETTFQNPVFHGTWGVSDEDLFTESDRILSDIHGPFCALILSTSNHQPFEFPTGRIEPYEQPLATVHNAMKYADWSLGHFFRLARQRPWFADTIFVIVADHNTRTYGDDLVPISKFRIPGLILGPGIPIQRYPLVASQIDLLPTVLPFLGLELETPLLGRDLLTLPADEPGRAIMQFGNLHAYRRDDRVVIHRPALPARPTGQLIPVCRRSARR